MSTSCCARSSLSSVLSDVLLELNFNSYGQILKFAYLNIFSKKAVYQMSRIVRKLDFCLGENKGADQLRGNREADQRLCFRYSDSTIPLLLESEISSFQLFSELVQAGLCRTWSETPKTGFLASRLRSFL